MNMLGAVLVCVLGVVAGSLVGFVSGFAMTSHVDVLRGVRPATTNWFVLLFARPGDEIRGWRAVLFLVLILAWVPAFFVLCALPVIVAGKVRVEEPVIFLAYALAALAFIPLRKFGAHVWRAMT